METRRSLADKEHDEFRARLQDRMESVRPAAVRRHDELNATNQERADDRRDAKREKVQRDRRNRRTAIVGAAAVVVAGAVGLEVVPPLLNATAPEARAAAAANNPNHSPKGVPAYTALEITGGNTGTNVRSTPYVDPDGKSNILFPVAPGQHISPDAAISYSYGYDRDTWLGFTVNIDNKIQRGWVDISQDGTNVTVNGIEASEASASNNERVIQKGDNFYLETPTGSFEVPPVTPPIQ